MDKAGLRKVYDEIDLPLVPVLARMEEAGVKLDCEVLAEMSQRLEREAQAKAREIYEKVRRRVQHQFAEAARRRALQQAQPAQAIQVRQGQNDFDRGGRARRLGAESTRFRGWCWITASFPS